MGPVPFYRPLADASSQWLRPRAVSTLVREPPSRKRHPSAHPLYRAPPVIQTSPAVRNWISTAPPHQCTNNLVCSIYRNVFANGENSSSISNNIDQITIIIILPIDSGRTPWTTKRKRATVSYTWLSPYSAYQPLHHFRRFSSTYLAWGIQAIRRIHPPLKPTFLDNPGRLQLSRSLWSPASLQSGIGSPSAQV